MLKTVFISSIYLAVFISGISNETALISLLVSLLSACLGFIILLKNGQNIKLPQNFGVMSLFIIILQLYLFFLNDKLNPFYFTTTLIQGLLYWVIFTNITFGARVLKRLLITMALFYTSLYILTVQFDLNLIKLANLFFGQNSPTRHWDIGNLWSFLLIVIIGTKWNKLDLPSILIISLGFIFLGLSNVRSALLSLIFGISYVFYNTEYFYKSSKKFVYLVISILSLLFIITSLNKTTIFDRPYYIQSIESLAIYPFGVGIGNFKNIATLYFNKGTDGDMLSISTFNILLEALSGVGIFSVIFLYFLIKVTKQLLKRNKTDSIVWGALIITILVNFMLDSSYTIPSLVWIFYMALGIFEKKNKLT